MVVVVGGGDITVVAIAMITMIAMLLLFNPNIVPSLEDISPMGRRFLKVKFLSTV